MRITDALQFGKSKIHSDLAKILLADLLGKNPLELYVCLDEEIDEAIYTQYQREVDAIHNGTPIQYAMGHVNFYGREFYVNENVLIPRFETEEVVEKALSKIKEKFLDFHLKVLDIGCGSGVIGLTLKDKMKDLDVTLTDISEKALEVALANQEKLHLDVQIKKGDMLNDLAIEKFDIIISNPPYIREKEPIEEIVKNNEPSIALYAGEDGLLYYEQILRRASLYLKDKFLIVFEIGCEQKEAVTRLAEKYLTNIKIECFKDMQDRDRILVIENADIVG